MKEIARDRSEGFPNGIFCPCALWARGLARLKNCRRVAAAADAAAVVGVTWKFRLTFWLGNYIWSLSLWSWTQMGHLGTSVPGFCTEFRYLSYRHSGLAWGAILGKITKNSENALFQKMGMSKNSKKYKLPEKKSPEANVRSAARSL